MTIALHFTAQFNQTYADAFHAAILTIRNRPAGAEMLRQIERSTKVVTVRKDQRNSCTPDAADDSCYREVLNDDAFYDALARIATNPTNERTEWVQAFKKAKIEWREHHKSGALLIVRKETSRLERGKGAYYLMHLLNAGPGSDALVRWDGERDKAGQDDALWNDRPAWVALAHELIHAWRIVTGRCVFHPEDATGTDYEEYMTVGIPPYDSLPYTENNFRLIAGVAQRNWYREATREKSERAWRRYSPTP